MLADRSGLTGTIRNTGLQDQVFGSTDGFRFESDWWSGAGNIRFCLAKRLSSAVHPPDGYPANQWFTLPRDMLIRSPRCCKR